MFASQYVNLLSSFYEVRHLTYLTQKLIFPNKGNMDKIQAGEKDKKINGPFLIQLAYDTKILLIIGTIPLLQPVELPTMMIKPPTVIMFET